MLPAQVEAWNTDENVHRIGLPTSKWKSTAERRGRSVVSGAAFRAVLPAGELSPILISGRGEVGAPCSARFDSIAMGVNA
jgi:hypothetical protein